MACAAASPTNKVSDVECAPSSASASTSSDPTAITPCEVCCPSCTGSVSATRLKIFLINERPPSLSPPWRVKLALGPAPPLALAAALAAWLRSEALDTALDEPVAREVLDTLLETESKGSGRRPCARDGVEASLTDIASNATAAAWPKKIWSRATQWSHMAFESALKTYTRPEAMMSNERGTSAGRPRATTSLCEGVRIALGSNWRRSMAPYRLVSFSSE